MKKIFYIAFSLFLAINLQAQDRTQPKPGPAPAINIKNPESFTLKNGLKVLIVENHKLPRVSFTLTMDNPPYAEGNKKGVSDLLSAMIGNGTTSIAKDEFNSEIDFLGANINFGASGASANGLSRYTSRLLELMADGAINPLFVQEEFEKEKAKLIEGLKADEKSATSIARRVENVLTYGKNHYRGEFTSEETLNNVTLNDVILNYNTYFVPANAYLVVVGDVDLKVIKEEIEKTFGQWKKATAPQLSHSNPIDVQYSQINFIDVPNAVQSEIAVVNLSNLKMTDKDYFAAILANQILGGGGEGRLFLNLREAHGWTYGSYSSINADKYINKFRSSAAVRNAVTDSAVVEIFNELKRIRTELVSTEELKNAKAKYVGNFVMQIEKPSTVARYALNKETQNLPSDFYENYIKNINAVTAEDIKNAAQKYFSVDKARVVIAGKASDVLPALEIMSKKEKLPIFYFDKYGNPTEKPVVKKELPKDVTLESVLKNHINAIGGEESLKKVKTLAIFANASIQGNQIEFTTKFAENKFSTEGNAMGMSIFKLVYNNGKGYSVMQGQRQEFTKEQIESYKGKASAFPELSLLKDKEAKLVGIENINDEEVYVVKSGNSSYFYSVKTGLKTGASSEVEQMGQKTTQTTYFSDYKDVNGIKFPYKTITNMGMNIEMTTTEVKINDGVNDKDFE